MKNKNISLVITALLIVLLLFLNPFNLWMPSELVYFMLIGIIILFGLFAGLIWKEGSGDERERQHQMAAGRVAYLATISVLVLGIIIESLSGHADTWLIIALAVAVAAKLVSHLYNEKYK